MGGDWEGAVYAATVGTDGVLEEVVLPTAEGMAQMEVEGSDAAYVAFDRFNAPELVVSTDGASWNRVTVPGATAGRHAVRDVELDGPRLIVVVVDTESGATQLVLGGVGPGGQVAWDADRPAPFDSATIDSITLGGGTFLALGWDRDALVPRVWRSTDGLTWTDLRVDPATFGGALGDEPVFALGRWYAATDAIYMSDDGASWAEVYRPPAPAVEHPGCPPADEATMLDVMFLGGLAAGCFGNASLTVTAWITVPEGLGGCCWPSGEPEWLNAPIPTGFLAPGPAGFVGSVGVYPVPDVADEFETPRRSRVTGHFQDPAAQECRRIPQPNYPHQLEARSEVVSECERRFVVDRVEPAN